MKQPRTLKEIYKLLSHLSYIDDYYAWGRTVIATTTTKRLIREAYKRGIIDAAKRMKAKN